MPRTLTQPATEQLSDRDAAWLEELAESIARARAALAERPPARGAALVALADAGAYLEDEALANERPSDVSGAAAILTALALSGRATRAAFAETIHESLNVLLESQNADGGWPSANGRTSCPAATGRALEALGHFGFRTAQAPVAAAVKFLLAAQDEGGAWREAWGILAGLRAVGFDTYAMAVRRAVRWLKESQNEDGGWGEGGAGESTAAGTAGALLALLTTCEAEGAEARAGAEYLVGTQRGDGTWRSADGTLPLLALARYAKAVGAAARRGIIAG